MGSEGADKIVHEIVRITDAQVELILQEARKDADEIRGESKKKAQAKKTAIMAKGQQQAEREQQRVLADAKMQVKREIFDVKEDLIKKSFGDAEERLKKLADSPEYSEILKKMIVESAVVVGGGSFEVLVRKKDRALLSGEFLADLGKEISTATGEDTELELSDEVITWPRSSSGEHRDARRVGCKPGLFFISAPFRCSFSCCPCCRAHHICADPPPGGRDSKLRLFEFSNTGDVEQNHPGGEAQGDDRGILPNY